LQPATSFLPSRFPPTQAEYVLIELTAAEQQLMEAQLAQSQHKVWFWRFKEAARKKVAAGQPAVDAATQRVKAVRARRDQLLREAKAVLGLWSGEPSLEL